MFKLHIFKLKQKISAKKCQKSRTNNESFGGWETNSKI